jgi:peptidoglycan-N-acetylglucosamine deacetylase
MKRLSVALTVSFAATACHLGDDHGHDDHAHDPDEIGALFEAAYEEVNFGKVDHHNCSGVTVPDRPGFGKRVALTFDDGPNLNTTPQVMSVLRRHGVPATFFINGNRASSPAAEDLIAEMVADPLFIVANHSWSHRQMTRLSASDVSREIDDTASVIRRQGGDARYFRFPFGASSCSTASAVRSRGFEVTGWHVDSADWCFSGGTPGHCPERTFAHVDNAFRHDMVGFTMQQVNRNSGGIVLFHDIHRYTADNIERIILELDAAGYSFVNIDDVNVFPRLNAAFTDGPPDPIDPVDPVDPIDDGDAIIATVVDTGGSGLRLREGPSSDHDILTVMPEGASVVVLDGPEGQWYRVRYGTIEGWAHGAYLSF